MIPPNTFADQAGIVPASELDENFTAAASQAEVDALTATVADLPSDSVPLAPTAPGSAGVAADTSRADHAHPSQTNRLNTQTGTTYTLQTTDHGRVVELSNVASITVTVPATLDTDFNCLLVQASTGQVTIAAGSGATQRSFNAQDTTSGQWAAVSLYVRANPGGSAAEYVLAGNMS